MYAINCLFSGSDRKKNAEINVGDVCHTFLNQTKEVSVTITLFHSIIAPQLVGTSLMIKNAGGRLINTALDMRVRQGKQAFVSGGP